MKNPIVPIFEYGYYGYNVFELPSQAIDVSMLPKNDKTSMVNTTFNMGSKSVLVDIDINTGEYYEMKVNEGDYENLIDFIKVNQISKIPKIGSMVKILMDYTLTTADGATVDAGIRISEVPMSDCSILMPICGNVIAPYRVAKYFATTFIIDRFRSYGAVRGIRTFTPYGYSQYCCTPECNTEYVLHINSIRVFGEEAGKERHLPKSMNGGHYAIGCETVRDMEKNSVELFSSIWYDLSFNSCKIPGYASSISIPIEIVTPMIVTTNVSEIDALLADNAQNFYPGDEPGEIVIDMFKPLIQRPHCPGTLPHDYFKYWELKEPPVAPDHHGNGCCSHPICPGPEWPAHGNVQIDVNHIDKNTPPGVYSSTGLMKYSWKTLRDNGAILFTYRGDVTVISTPDTKVRGAKIDSSDIGPILVIPAPDVTGGMVIGESAFFGYENLESVYLPKGVHRIERHAFYSCKKLEGVYNISGGEDGVRQICDNAFMNCMSLRQVDTSIMLDTIGERAFYHCSLLKLIVPPSVGTIGENAFHEVFRVVCSPKTDLTGTGINPNDVEFFTEDSPYYNPDDYAETPGEGGETNGDNTGDSGSGETTPDNPSGSTETSGTDDSNTGDNTESGSEPSSGGDGTGGETDPVTPPSPSYEEGSGEV